MSVNVKINKYAQNIKNTYTYTYTYTYFYIKTPSPL